MNIQAIKTGYFNFPEELRNWNNNSWKTNCLAVLKVVSLATGIIPLGFFIADRILLSCRVTQKPNAPQVQVIEQVAQSVLPQPIASPPVIRSPIPPKPNYYELVLNGQLNKVLEALKDNSFELGVLARSLARTCHCEEAFEVAKAMPDVTSQDRYNKDSVLGTIFRRMPEISAYADAVQDYIQERKEAEVERLDAKDKENLAHVKDLLKQGKYDDVTDALGRILTTSEEYSLATIAIVTTVAKNEDGHYPKFKVLDFIGGYSGYRDYKMAKFLTIAVDFFIQANTLPEAITYFNDVVSHYPKGSFGEGTLREEYIHFFSVALAKNGKFEESLAQFNRIQENRHKGIKDLCRSNLAKQFAKQGKLEQAEQMAGDITNRQLQKTARGHISWGLINSHRIEEGNARITSDTIRSDYAIKLAKRGKIAEAKLLTTHISSPEMQAELSRYINKKERQ